MDLLKREADGSAVRFKREFSNKGPVRQLSSSPRHKPTMGEMSGFNTFQLPMPDPTHNIKSVRSALFWYWVFLDNNLINLRMLLVVRRDSSPAVSLPMNKAVTIMALKNKDRMSVETAVEVFLPEVQRAIPKDVVTAIVPEIYTFWQQNRPGTLACPVDIAVHQTSGTIFFSD